MITRSAFCLPPSAFRFPLSAFCLLLLAACATAPAQTPVVIGVSIQEAQRMLDAATATAQAAATQSALATGTRVREQELLADDQTRTAAQAQAVSTQLAATPTAFSQMATATDYAFDRRARETAFAVQSAATQAASVRQEESSSRWGFFFVGLAIVLAFGLLVLWTYLHNLGRVHIASLAFRALGGDVVAEWTPREGWQTWRTPAALPPPISEAMTPETRAEHAQKAWLAKLDDDWRTFYRRLVMWAQYAGSWSNSALCDKLDVLSNEAWQQATQEMVSAGYLIRQGGKNKRETVWHPDWSYARFMEQNRAGYVPHPAAEPPAIKAPHHITTTPQPVTASQQEITLYAVEDP
jgi:hypothetical protein